MPRRGFSRRRAPCAPRVAAIRGRCQTVRAAPRAPRAGERVTVVGGAELPLSRVSVCGSPQGGGSCHPAPALGSRGSPVKSSPSPSEGTWAERAELSAGSPPGTLRPWANCRKLCLQRPLPVSQAAPREPLCEQPGRGLRAGGSCSWPPPRAGSWGGRSSNKRAAAGGAREVLFC